MAHMIDMSNGRANMAYVGATPWHGLGAQLQDGANIEQWREQAGMMYSVLRAPVQFMNGSLHTFTGKDVLYRSDTNAPLGVVSDGYKIVQPADVLEFFRDLCADQGFALETAGVLKEGALYWALAKTGHTMTLPGNDRTDGYVLLSTSADGTRSTDARFTSIRVVCNNTLSLAMGANKSAVKTSHRSTFDAKATKKELGLVAYDNAWERFRDQMTALQSKQITQSTATNFFSELLRPNSTKTSATIESAVKFYADSQSHTQMGAQFLAEMLSDQGPKQEQSGRAIRGLAELEYSYRAAPGAAPGTAYGLVQAVTHYIDHSRGASNDKRLTSAWFGQGDTLKTKALDAALELVSL